MSDIKLLRHLPELTPQQEFVCEGGCDHVKPKEYRNVYSQSFDPKTGELLQEMAEIYYTCQRNDILMIWDNDLNDYVDAPEKYYKENNQ